MTKHTICLFCMATSIVVASCSNDEPKGSLLDREKPAIVDGAVPNPIECQVYHRGDVIPFLYTFTDNVELGNYNIEIHNNFDHHTHSTESSGDCPLDPIKKPINPWVYNQDYSIPSALKKYEAKVDIIPKNIDTGDYHFMIRVTDKAGWQQLKAISIKVIE